mgnify:FL=1
MKKLIENLIMKDYPQGHITQWFGENPTLYNWLGLKGHNGIDIVAPYGTPIYAFKKGHVVNTEFQNGGYGGHIRIMDNDYEYIYAHLSKIDVKNGWFVEEGQKIGEMGNTGFVVSGSTPFWKYNPYAGTHLHFGIRPYSQEGTPFMVHYPSGDERYLLLWENGFKGSIDPKTFIEPNLETQKEKQTKTILLTMVSVYNQLIALIKGRR